MRNALAWIACVLLGPFFARGAAAGPVAELQLLEPRDYQVCQRRTLAGGDIAIRCPSPRVRDVPIYWEARLLQRGQPGPWQSLSLISKEGLLTMQVPAPAGGWYRLEVRALAANGSVVAAAAVPHVGMGEVFVVAGQSNSANHGEERQSPQTDRVAAWTGQGWQPAEDPQPGASGRGGSFIPPLGDELVRRFNVPVGFIACGIGATSVREWLPPGATFPHPPTIESRVERRADGSWASKGEAFHRLVDQLRPLGPLGCRAILWHQGESDANQKDSTRTLPGDLYRTYLAQLIAATRQAVGWEVPWFVAQASYHVPGDEASPEIRAAQAALWRAGMALEGPDTDALKGELRERQGQGVHFSGPGLRAHASSWAEKVGPWLAQQLAATPGEGFHAREAEDRLVITHSGEPVATFVFRDSRILRPYFANVHAPGARLATRRHPPVAGVDPMDHDTMHPGLWLAFGDLNGVDFWRNQGRIEHVRFTQPPTQASKGMQRAFCFATECRLRDTKGGEIGSLTNEFTLVKSFEGWLIGWKASFRSDTTDLVFGDQEEMGFGARMATGLTEKESGRLTNRNGQSTARGTWGQAAEWCDYSGMLAGHPVGITLFPLSPARLPCWWHNRDYGVFVANPFGRAAMKQGAKSAITVKRGDTWAIHFGAMIHAVPGSPKSTGFHSALLRKSYSPAPTTTP